MTAYFDATDTDDKALLPTDYRTATNMAFHAGQAEADIITHFTATLPLLQNLLSFGEPGTFTVTGDTQGIFTDLGDGRGVYLRSYTASAADCASAAFVTAMKRTVADVTLWRCRQETRDTATTQETKVGSTSRAYPSHHDAPFPRHWDRHLRSFDTRIPAWGL